MYTNRRRAVKLAVSPADGARSVACNVAGSSVRRGFVAGSLRLPWPASVFAERQK
jgi:hypothetical protein